MASNDLHGYHVLQYIFAILAVVLNGVLLVCMYKERKKIFVSRISYLVANLAFADFLNGLFILVLQQPIERIDHKTEVNITINIPFIWTAFCVSFYTLFLMAVERWVVVTKPMDWSTLLTVPRTLISIALVWIVSVACGLGIHYDVFYAQFFICLIVEISALYFIATHVYILVLLQRRNKRRQKMAVSPDSSQATPCLEQQLPNESSHIAHRKVTIVVTILLGVMIVTCIPHFICVQMFTVQNTFDDSLASKINVELFMQVFHWSDALSYINYFANPIIYGWRLRMYRKAFYSLLGRSSSA